MADRWNAAHDDDDALLQDPENHLVDGVVLHVDAVLRRVGSAVDIVRLENGHDHGEDREAHDEDETESVAERHLETPDEVHRERNVGKIGKGVERCCVWGNVSELING